MVGFLFGGSTNETPETLKRKRELAMAILGAHAAPKNVGEGLSALGAGIAAGVMNRRADKAEGEGRASADALFSGGLKGQLAGSIMGLAPNVSASASAAGGAGSYRDAIASIESKGSGDYSAIGPTNAKLGRPLGRYQVMEANIGPWSKEAVGREVSAEEFLANPQIQDFVFDHKFNQYAQQFGPEGAAQAWFAGPGGVGKTNRKDVLGTDVGTYGNKFMAALGPQGQPQQVASLDPSIGMPSEHPQSAAPMQGPPMPSLSDEVAEFRQAPEYAARFPGQNVGVNAQPQQSSPQPPGIPPQFQGSQQLADAQGGIMPALMGGPPASPQQIAQARARGAAQQQPQQQSGPDQATLYQILTHPFSTPEQKAVAQMMLQQQMQTAEAQREQQVWLQRQQYEAEQQRSDPGYQLGLEKTRIEIEEAKKKRQPLVNAGNGNVYDPNEDKWLTPPTGGNGQFRFSGNSVEAQALNGLMDGGRLTPEQAQQLAAGKTITGPNGEIIFMTPQGVFGQPANGGQAQPIGSGQSALPSPPAQQGNIQITRPKVTVDEKEAATFADRMNNSGSLIDEFGAAAPSAWDQFIRGNDYIPDMIENLAVSGDFQKLDQARRDFINAQLRRESGAVISPEEFDNANKQYFPQFGDGEEVIGQKRRNRQTVIQGMTRSAGPTYGGGRDNADPLGIR